MIYIMDVLKMSPESLVFAVWLLTKVLKVLKDIFKMSAVLFLLERKCH